MASLRPEIRNFIVAIRDDKTEVNCKSNPTMHWIPISKTGFYMVLVLDAGLITLRLMRLDFFKLLLNKLH